MKKLVSLSVILSIFSCGSDIVPDSQKVCALMEDQIGFLPAAPMAARRHRSSRSKCRSQGCQALCGFL